LRIRSAASAEFNRRLQTAWQAVSEQPLELIAMSDEDWQLLRNNSTNGLPADRTSQTDSKKPAGLDKQTDLFLFTNQQMGILQQAQALAPLPDKLWESSQEKHGKLLTALANDTSRWGSERFALPLGTSVPALWARDDTAVRACDTWDQYQEALDELGPGKGAEPLAEGWAAMTFLYRAATMAGGTWLFDRQTMQPVITAAPYQRALEQLVRARKSYSDELLTPAEILTQLQAGNLSLAVTWPTPIPPSHSDTGQLAIQPLPQSSQVFVEDWQDGTGFPSLPMVSDQGLVIALSRGCRQSGIARNFLNWLVSQEGWLALSYIFGEVFPIRNATDSQATPSSNTTAASSQGSLASARGYNAYVERVLGKPQVRPTLRIPGAEQYMQVLDVQVRAAIAGERTPADALQLVHQGWEQITEQLGRKAQANSWRLAQGMRER
jgi:ABC-type glycerol-3-phosphate transport system substrate-binding protein